MNNFTKEELELIDDALSRMMGKWNKKLREKIQYMLKVHCQNGNHTYQFSLGPGYCENCGEKE